MTKRAEKNLSKIDSVANKRIQEMLIRIENLKNPRELGHALTGPLSDLWSYRVGDYRAICKIKDEEIIILVVEIEHKGVKKSWEY